MGSYYTSDELADEDGVFINENSGNMILSSVIYPDAANVNSNMTASAPASQDDIQEHNMSTVPREGLGNPDDEFAAFDRDAVSPHTPNKTPSIDEMSGDGEMIKVEPFNRPEDTYSEPGPFYSNDYDESMRNQTNIALNPSRQTMNAGYVNPDAGYLCHPHTNSYAGPGNQNPAPGPVYSYEYGKTRSWTNMALDPSHQAISTGYLNTNADYSPYINSYTGPGNQNPASGSFEYGQTGNQTIMASNSSHQIPYVNNFNQNVDHLYTTSSANPGNQAPTLNEQKNHSKKVIKCSQPIRQGQKKNPHIAKAPSKVKMNKKSGSRKSTDVETILDPCEEAIENCDPKKISPLKRRGRGTLKPEEEKQNRKDINTRSIERQKEHPLNLENLKKELEAKLNDILQKRGNNGIQDEAAGTSATNNDGKKRTKWSGNKYERRRQSNKQAQQKQRDKKKQIIEDLKNEIREIWKKIDYYTNLVNSLQDLYDEKANY
ncbi:hypothetical protein WR25_08294 isoform C [Diploscapter pachys]|uniref:BZIP domain-containing protein n=2 Tax=Diploscapter pachys TaxID=2018661 RepID=A0A2A2KXS0_9BILA|nr:hypothetical protein WR25_08294 isoform C [Diploscapter pachys]